jgi:hypothetical protein
MKMTINEANWDRILRAIVGVLLFALALTGAVSGLWLYVAYVLGAIMLLTGVSGFCPLYALAKISTKK